FNPLADVRITRHNLPHWDQPGATYFVTFRLGDSLPATLLAAWKTERDAWLKARHAPLSAEDEHEYHRLFSARIDQWLDDGHGACILRHPQASDRVVEALRHFDAERYRLASWVVMPNHVHVCFVINATWRVEQVMHSWKRHAANEINRLMGKSGAVWQRDYFDRLVRNAEHLGRVCATSAVTR